MLVCNLHSPPTYKNISKTIHKHIYIVIYVLHVLYIHVIYPYMTIVVYVRIHEVFRTCFRVHVSSIAD